MIEKKPMPLLDNPAAMIGVIATVLTIGLLCGALIVSLQAAWTLVAVRVAGSWVAAVGMLMLGWLVKGGR